MHENIRLLFGPTTSEDKDSMIQRLTLLTELVEKGDLVGIGVDHKDREHKGLLITFNVGDKNYMPIGILWEPYMVAEEMDSWVYSPDMDLDEVMEGLE